MARPRRKPETAWERRNREAREKGYRNYYDYRVHDYGKRPPGEPVPPADRATRAGGRGEAAFRSTLKRPGRIALIGEIYTQPRGDGTYANLKYIVTYTNGSIRTFDVPWDDAEDLDYWHDYFDDHEIDYIAYVRGE